jgi:pimeloyl-ACP methyl ester carboxylesterase
MTSSISNEKLADDSFQAAAHHVHFDSAGSGLPLIFVHGDAGSAKQWKRLFEHFRPTRHVFAYDLIGCGLSRPIDAGMSLRCESSIYAHDAEVLLAAIDRLGGHADVVAHSGGSLGALLAALERPGAIRTLTLFEPVLFDLLREAADPELQPVLDHARTYRELFEHHGAAAAMAAFVEFWNGPGTWQRLPDLVRDAMLSGADRLYCEWGLLLSGASGPTRADLARLFTPVLYLCGDRTIAPVKRITEIAQAALPSCRAVTVQGATHMAPFTHAAQVIGDLEAHLAR